jgi:membrane peptidoglycan carboxypeptidase
MNTLTQSLGKKLGFERFHPGINKIRLIGYAMGLEQTLTKEQIVALFLDRAEMGRGPRGWMTGFYEASEAIYRRPPAALTDREFFSLVAVMIAPRRFDLSRPDVRLRQRVDRIERLTQGLCQPSGVRDVWLNGCAT